MGMTKREMAEHILDSEPVFIHLDPRHPEVRVPEEFRKGPMLVLQFGRGSQLPIPIRDLEVDRDGIRGTLSFQRVPHYVDVPWAAVYAIVNQAGSGAVWAEDAPPEIQEKRTRAAVETSVKREALRAVPPTPGDEPSAVKPAIRHAGFASGRSTTKKGTRLPEYMRIVK
jgi:stringent starvation protein B